MKTTIIEIDSELLFHFNRVAAVLGIAPAKYIESFLKELPANLGLDPVLFVANESLAGHTSLESSQRQPRCGLKPMR
jgi:hypothetical protein